MKTNHKNKADFTKVSVICNYGHQNAQMIAEKIVEFFIKKNLNNKIQITKFDTKNLPQDYDSSATFVIAIGGDGTILSTSRFYSKLDIPVLGINSGRLGFLAQINPDETEKALTEIFENGFIIDERPILKAEINDKTLYAMNDFVIKGSMLSRTQHLHLDINGERVCDYLADGLIISTPTGSTAYTLSAGGPILYPTLDALIIVPICAHSLSSRPLVVPSTEVLTITTSEQFDCSYLTGDGQESLKILDKEIIRISKTDYSAKLVNLSYCDFYNVLKEKLNWGKSFKDIK